MGSGGVENPYKKIEALESAIGVARRFIEELCLLCGKYPQANGTNIVRDAYAVLREIDKYERGSHSSN